MFIIRNLSRLLAAGRFHQVISELAPLRPELLASWRQLLARQPAAAVQDLAYALAILRVSEVAPGSHLPIATWVAQLLSPKVDGSFPSVLTAAVVARAMHAASACSAGASSAPAIQFLSSLQEPDGIFHEPADLPRTTITSKAPASDTPASDTPASEPPASQKSAKPNTAKHELATTAAALCLVADLPGAAESLRIDSAITHLTALHHHGHLPGPAQHALALLKLRSRSTRQPARPTRFSPDVFADDLFAIAS